MCIRDSRHIVRIANRQSPGAVPQRIKFPGFMPSAAGAPPAAAAAATRALPRLGLCEETLAFLTIAASHQGNYATIANYLETELRYICLLYTSPSPRDRQKSRMPSSA